MGYLATAPAEDIFVAIDTKGGEEVHPVPELAAAMAKMGPSLQSIIPVDVRMSLILPGRPGQPDGGGFTPGIVNPNPIRPMPNT